MIAGPSKASTLNLRNPILGIDDWKILPEYSQWSKWMRSSVNYEDLGAGKLTNRQNYDIISNKET